MLWLIQIFLCFLFLFLLDCIMPYVRNRKKRARIRREKQIMLREFEDNLPYPFLDAENYIEDIYDRFGFIRGELIICICSLKCQPKELTAKQIIQLIKHARKLLWRQINRRKHVSNLREFLRLQIKVIDDEELAYSF